MTSTAARVKISFDQLLTRSYRTYRRSPVLVVPTMLQTSLQVMYQAIIIVPGLFILLQFLRSGSLQSLVTAITNRQFGQIMTIVLAPQFFGPLAAYVAVVTLGVALLNVIGGGIFAAAEFGTYAAVVEGGDGSVSTATIFRSMSKLWRGLVLTELVYSIIVFGPLVLGVSLLVVGLYGAVASSFSAESIALLLLGSLGSLAGAISAAFLALFGVYTFPVAVLEGKLGLAAYRRSYHIAREYLRLTVSYAAVRVATALAIAAVGVLTSYIGVPLSSFGQAAATFFLLPLMHLSKTSMYYDIAHGNSLVFEIGSPPDQVPGRGLGRDVLALVRRGLREVLGYVFSARNLVYHAGAVLLFILGIYVGEVIADNGLGDILRQLGVAQGQRSAIAGLSPVPLGFDIFFHNWQVAIAVALSGVGFIVPTAVSMMFNGIILGALARVVPRLSYLLVGILPHGVIELPSFFVAGSIGLKLGVYCVRALARHRAGEDEELSRVLRQAVLVSVGLGPLFLIAGLIEAILTPALLARFG